jgi:hypothetical protein
MTRISAQAPKEMTTVELLREAGEFIAHKSPLAFHQELAQQLFARATRLEGETGQQNQIAKHTAKHINAPGRVGK